MRIWARRLLCLEPMVISEEEHEQMPEPVRERLEALKDAPGSVIVVGSMNADYTVTTKRLPKPGETVNGGAMKVLPGGKGANQASATPLKRSARWALRCWARWARTPTRTSY